MLTRVNSAMKRLRPRGARDGSGLPNEVMVASHGARTIPRAPWKTIASLVPVVVGLERALDRHAQVLRLLRREFGQLGAHLAQVEHRHLLVELLGQHEDLAGLELLAGV